MSHRALLGMSRPCSTLLLGNQDLDRHDRCLPGDVAAAILCQSYVGSRCHLPFPGLSSHLPDDFSHLSQAGRPCGMAFGA